MQKEKVIKSNIVKTVAAYIIGISCLLFGALWTISTWGHISNSLLLGLVFIGLGLYITGNTLMAVQEIILKPEKIILIGSFSKEELTHEQIRNVTLSSMLQYRRQFRRKVIELVVIYPVSGGSITLNNRLGHPEFLYDTLMNWWEKPNKNMYYDLERD